jgi:hypothetical protein
VVAAVVAAVTYVVLVLCPVCDQLTYDPRTQQCSDCAWYSDPDELVRFARWYFDGARNITARGVIDLFDTPWKWNQTYKDWKKENR